MNKNLKNLSEVAKKELDELFEFVSKWAKKQESNVLYVEGVLSMAIFDDETDELLGSRYSSNITSLEVLDAHLEDIKEEIEKEEESK